jgi:SAM-dependent methyltransferase
MTYAGFRHILDQDAPHLGGNIREGDPFTFAPSVWDYLIDRFAAGSFLDLGSGIGHAADYFARKGLRGVAVDGLAANVEDAVFPTVLHDLEKGPLRMKVDLVHCQEVVEHIDGAYVGNIIETLLSGRIIAMTHAVPGQGGIHHVNCQSSDYWIQHLRDRGGELLAEDTDRVRALAEKDGARYLAATGLVFANRNRR